MFRCTLTDRNGTADITDEVRNWDDIEATYKRDGYGGVVRSFTDKFEFVGEARKRLLSLFDEDYLSASAKVSLSVREDDMEYHEEFSCDMDFTTMDDDGVTLSMNAVDNDVAAIIKAKKGTEYEYSVDVIKEAETLEYDGIEVSEQVKWQFVSNEPEGTSIADEIPIMALYGDYTVPLYIISEDVQIGTLVDFSDQIDADESTNIITGIGDCIIDFEVSISAKIYELYVQVNGMTSLVQGLRFIIYKKMANGETSVLDELELKSTSFQEEIKSASHHSYQSIREGERIRITVQLIGEHPSASTNYTYNLLSTSYVKATWHNRLSRPVSIDVVKPVTLLNRLLKSMNGGNDGITGEIVPSDRTDMAVLCAAESIRGIPQAKMYSSFTKFCEWMEAVFGYVYGIDGNRVTFRSRESFFTETVYKHVYEYADYGMEVDTGLVFSNVNAGYDKQDYDSINGRDEFNFTNRYTTGILNTENSLDLISPYRADAFGVEFLAEKRGEDTTDSDSDKDLFFIGARLSGGKYVIDRTPVIEGVNSPSTMFNAMFSPSSVITANAGYIGACTGKLSYASADGNSEVSIDGRKENRDMDMGNPLFSAVRVKFETCDTELPESLDGAVVLHHAEGDIYGYVADVDCMYTRRKAAKYTIIVKRDRE